MREASNPKMGLPLALALVLALTLGLASALALVLVLVLVDPPWGFGWNVNHLFSSQCYNG